MISFFILTFLDISFSGSLLTIGGTGIIYKENFTEKNVPVTLIKTVEINDGITELAESLFTSFTNLEAVTLPDSLKKINSQVFRNTKIEHLHIPIGVNNITTINYMFYFNSKHKSITVDPSNSFYSSYDDCLYNRDFSELLCVPSQKNSVTFHPNVKAFKTWSFYSTRIKKINVPDEVSSFASMTVVDCYSLNELIFTKNSMATYFPSMFVWNAGLYNFTCPPLLKTLDSNSLANSGIRNFYIYENCTLKYLNSDVFLNCVNLRTVDLPGTVESISTTAFKGCKALEEVNIIGPCEKYKSTNGALYTSDESKLYFLPPSIKNIEIPANTTTISTSVLQKCESVQSLSVNESNNVFKEYHGILYINGYSGAIHSIGSITTAIIHFNATKLWDSLFQYVPRLEKVIFESQENLTTVGSLCFKDVKTLNNISLPSSVVTLSSEAFCGCSITSFHLPRLVKTIPTNCFLGSSISEFTFEDGSVLETIQNNGFAHCSHLSIFNFPSGVLEISDSAFESSGITSFTFVDSIKNIKKSAMKSTKITEVVFSADANLTTLGDSSFSYCSGLTSVVLPPKIKSIGSSCFDSCFTLSVITFLGDSDLRTIGDSAFKSTKIEVFHVPNMIESIVSNAFYKCSSLDTFVTENSIRYNAVDGVLYNFNKSILEIFPPGRVQCSLYHECTKIGPNAFIGATKLESIDFGSNSRLSQIGDSTFEECTSLTSVSLPGSVTSIGDNSFKGCSKLKSIFVRDESALSSIGKSAFSGCNNIQNITFEGTCSLRSFGSALFKDFCFLSYVKLPLNLTSIDDSLFQNCSSLSRIDIPNSVVNVSAFAFADCTNLTNVTLPSMLVTIHSNAFSNCPNISNIVYCGFNPFNDHIFDSSVEPSLAVFTLNTYPFSSVFGITCQRVMHRCHMFPTKIFTAQSKCAIDIPVFIAGIIAQNEEDK